jgi:AhpC/TSA family protein
MKVFPRLVLLGLAWGSVVVGARAQPASTPAQPPPPPPPAVKVGEPAPDFTLPYLAASAAGGKIEKKEFKLSDYKGKGEVIVAFFPAAFSPG